jgi:HK97 family phage major capsid protein
MKLKEFLKQMRAKCDDELEALKARLDELEKINEQSDDEEELKAAGEELDALKAKKAELEAELADIDAQIKAIEGDEPAPAEQQPQRKAFIKMEERTMPEKEKIEERAKAFKKSGAMTIEARALLVSSGTIATPTEVNGINELSGTVSSIVDLVDVQNAEGMGSNVVAYEYSAPKGGITIEGKTYSEGDTVFDKKTIAPEKVTIISYISEEVTNQSPLDYEGKVKRNALNALRKKVSEYIVGKIVASDLKVAKTIAAIDDKTLRNIALAYGGDEEVDGSATLVLNKATLVKLGDVRGTSEKKAIYEITPDAGNPNTGVIKDGGLAVNYVLNGNVSDDTLIYGQLGKFELDLFSEYKIKVSEDFRFSEGLLAIRGSVQIGGDVVYKDGFIVASVSA